MKKFFQTLFSAVNDKNHKIITVLGFKLKFRNKNTVKIDDSSLQKIKLLFANSTVISEFIIAKLCLCLVENF